MRLRLGKLAQRALHFHADMTNDLSINESVCFDGLENFAGTQYDPNNINQALGRDSLFIYTFNFCGLNRKGRMSPWQKTRNSEIEATLGRYDPKAIRKASCSLIKELYRKRNTAKPLTLLTDEHFQYRRVIQQDLAGLHIDHVTISSKACRNYQNILFSVNHADLLVRQHSKAFARETISFSKTPGAMCQKFALFLVRKNYMEPQFTKKHVRRPKAHTESPAQALGLCTKILEFEDIFNRRSTKQDTKSLSSDWRRFWHGEVPEQYRRSVEYRRGRSPVGPSMQVN